MKRILIVEDEQAMGRALMFKLQSEGFEVVMVHDGKAAITAIENSSVSYNLVILDLMMPVLDGFGVLKILKEKNILVPVMVASNLSQEQDVVRAKTLGAVDFLVKSDTSLKQIVEKVAKYMHQDSKT